MAQPAPLNDALLEIHGLELRRGSRSVLAGFDLAVERGERVALMGLSGEGKTTVLRAVAGLEPFDAGSIKVGRARLAAGGLPRGEMLAELRRSVGMVFQHHHLFSHMSALQNVWLAPLHAQGVARPEAEARARALLDSLGVAGRADAFPLQLSGGEAQRVAIARALATDPPLLLMDEPTAALDPARRGDLAATLKALAASGRTLLVATHDVEFAQTYASRVAVLAGGVIVEAGDPAEVLTRPSHAATRRLLQGDGGRPGNATDAGHGSAGL